MDRSGSRTGIRTWQWALALGAPAMLGLVLLLRLVGAGSSSTDRRVDPEARSGERAGPQESPGDQNSLPSVFGAAKAESTGEVSGLSDAGTPEWTKGPAVRAANALGATIEHLERLHESGKIREGYEECRRLIKCPIDEPEGYIRKLVGLRALALFSPKGTSWRQEAYDLLISVAKDVGSAGDFRKESIAALLGLHSLRINPSAFLPDDIRVPISQMFPESVLDRDSNSKIAGASFADIARADRELRNWLTEVAFSSTPVAPAFDFADDASETRFAAIVGSASFRDAEGLKVLRELSGSPAASEEVRSCAISCMLALVATGQRELYPDVMNALQEEQNPRMLISFAERIPRIEKKYSPHVDLLLGRLADIASKGREVQTFSHKAAGEAFHIFDSYYNRPTTTPDQMIRMREKLFKILAMVPTWKHVPAQMEILVTGNLDPTIRSALEHALTSGPATGSKDRCLKLLQKANP